MNGILKMSSFLFPLITFPYVSRVLGAEGIGQVNFAAALIGYFTMAAALGIPTYGIRICAQCRDNYEELCKTVQELMIISLVTTAAAYATLFFLIKNVSSLSSRSDILFVSSAAIVLNALGMEWLYQAVEEYGYITKRNLACKVLSVILMFLLVRNRDDDTWYAGISVIGTAGANFFNVIRAKKYLTHRVSGTYHFLRHWKPILVFFLFSAAASIYTSLDTVMLGMMTGDMQTGYYAAAVKMKYLLVSLVTALGTVLLPRASYYVETKQTQQYLHVLEKAFQFVIVSAVPLTLFFMLGSRDTIGFLAGEEFLPASAAMVIIMPTVFLIGLSNITGMQILIPLGMEWCTVCSTLAGAAADLGLNLVLIPKYGAVGAAVGTTAAEMIVLLIQLLEIKRKKQMQYVRIDKKDTCKICIAAAAAAVGMSAVQAVSGTHGYFWNLLLTAGTFFGIYGILLLVMRETLILSIFRLTK